MLKWKIKCIHFEVFINLTLQSITEAYDVDLIDNDEDETIETPYISLDNLDLDHLPIENCIK